MRRADRVTAVMKALADPTRRVLFERIVEAPQSSATALAQGLAVSQPAVSQHLQMLRRAHLVRERRHGRQVHYRAHPRGLAPLLDWLGIYAAFWRERFDELEKLLKEMEP
jgi:DNA-binding transcriptional ArsR family regulator